MKTECVGSPKKCPQGQGLQDTQKFQYIAGWCSKILISLDLSDSLPTQLIPLICPQKCYLRMPGSISFLWWFLALFVTAVLLGVMAHTVLLCYLTYITCPFLPIGTMLRHIYSGTVGSWNLGMKIVTWLRAVSNQAPPACIRRLLWILTVILFIFLYISQTQQPNYPSCSTPMQRGHALLEGYKYCCISDWKI